MVKRHMSQEHGTEGPDYDPYSYTQYKMYVDDKVFTLHIGLDVWAAAQESGLLMYKMSFLNHPMDPRGPRNTETDIIAQWEKDVGLTIEQFSKAYERVHGRPKGGCPTCGGPLESGSGYVGEEVIYCPKSTCGVVWSEVPSLSMIA